jgi:hypothetical protein
VFGTTRFGQLVAQHAFDVLAIEPALESFFQNESQPGADQLDALGLTMPAGGGGN